MNKYQKEVSRIAKGLYKYKNSAIPYKVWKKQVRKELTAK